jgi:hypothetical protein
MKKIIPLALLFLVLLISCKDIFKSANFGNFRIVNTSNKTIEFVWIAPEGEFFPTAESINIENNQVYETQGLEEGVYDIAIDFKGEFNSFNSKKNKTLCLYIDKGLTTVWYVDSSGNIITE